MKPLVAAAIALTLTIATLSSTAQAVFQNNGSGNWSNPASWTLLSGTSSTNYPVAGDTATITGGSTLTVDANAQCNELTINGGATLLFNSTASILTVSNGLTLTGASIINLNLGVLTVTGSMTISGASTATVNQGALTVIGLLLLNSPTSAGTTLLDIEGGAFSCAGGMTITATTIPAGRMAELRIANGAVNLAGGLATITANAKINFTGPGTMTLAGAISIANTASFIAGNGRVVYFGIPGSNQTIAPLTYYRLVITGVGTGVKQINGAVTVTDSLTLLTDTLTINSGGTLTLSDGITVIRTSGHILSAPTYAATANLVYNDIGRDTTGPEMPVAAGTLQNLTISNPGGIDLSRNITINNNLNLLLGPLFTDNFTLSLANAAGGTGSDPGITRTNGYILGSLTRSIGATTGLRIFPMGAGTAPYYREFDLTYTTAPATPGTITVVAADTAAPAQSGLPLNDNGENIVNIAPLYWEADAGNGLSGGNYTLTLTANGAPGVSDLSTLRIVKRPSTDGPWIADGLPGANTGTTSAPVITRTGMSGFSQFSIGSDNTNILPVNLTSFTGHATGNQVILDWTTSGETDNQSFTINHSTDGTHFTNLATLPGAGTTNIQQTYSYTQTNVPTGANYYRLQPTDHDGQSTYSPVISVTISGGSPGNTPPGTTGSGGTSLSLYPNPATTQLTIRSDSNASLQLYDNNGKFVQTLSAGANNISRLAPGIYYVKSIGSTLLFEKQ